MVLAQAPDPGGQGEDFGKSSPVGLVLLIIFFIAVAFLVRSMTKHLRKLPNTFDERKAASAAPARVQRREQEQAAKAAANQASEESGSSDDAGESEADSSGAASDSGKSAPDHADTAGSDSERESNGSAQAH